MTTPGRSGEPEPPPVGWPADGPAYRPTTPPLGPPVAPRSTPPAPPPGPPPATVRPTAPPPAAVPAGARPQQAPPRPATRPSPSPPPSAATRSMTVGPARKPGRKARLTVKRIDPWSTLKFSFVYSLAGLVVLLVAVIALYAIVDAMGVIDSIRSFLNDVEGDKNGGTIADWLGFGRVMTVALVVGCVNVILFTAFATLTAFVYNVCTDLVGGIEVTLADRN